jgi:hypothetical protein
MSFSISFETKAIEDFIIYKKPLFKDWSGNLVSWYTGLEGSGSRVNGRYINYFPSLLCGTMTSVNEATVALPNTLASEEDLLNNKTFLYNGRTNISKNMGSINDYIDQATIPGSYIGLCMVLGSGDTPPTKDDYKLDSWIPTTELSIQSYSGVGPNNQEIPTFMNSITSVYKNCTNENIVVKEIGLITTIGKSGQPTPQLNQITPHPILLVREILENPVIIKPDEITSFTVMIK